MNQRHFITPVELATVQERAEAALIGPWISEGDSVRRSVESIDADPTLPVDLVRALHLEVCGPTMTFIAATRKYVPLMAAEIWECWRTIRLLRMNKSTK